MGGGETVRETVGACGRAGSRLCETVRCVGRQEIVSETEGCVGGRETVRETVGACGRAGY